MLMKKKVDTSGLSRPVAYFDPKKLQLFRTDAGGRIPVYVSKSNWKVVEHYRMIKPEDRPMFPEFTYDQSVLLADSDRNTALMRIRFAQYFSGNIMLTHLDVPNQTIRYLISSRKRVPAWKEVHTWNLNRQ